MHKTNFNSLQHYLESQILGQPNLVKQLLIALLADGHILVEGPPGLAKTRAVKSLSDCVEGDFHRIQFTPDLLPADLTGTDIFRPETGEFTFQSGPIFNSLILADEINRAPAKVQAALLEAMQEKQVTLGDETLQLPSPFLVLATQNPVEQEGTYPLPEAQLDRFMLKLKLGYPSREEEMKILERMAGSSNPASVNVILNLDDIKKAQQAVNGVFVDDRIRGYTVDLVNATRFPAKNNCGDLEKFIENGASVRASINLIKVAKAQSLLQGRTFVSPHDIKTLSHEVLRHRISLSYEAEAQGKSTDDIIDEILTRIKVP